MLHEGSCGFKKKCSAPKVSGEIPDVILVYNAAPMVRAIHLVRFISLALLVSAALVSVRAQQPLRWGADPSGGAPYVFNDPAHPDQYIGYEKEMVDALAAAMGRQAEFVPSDWETLVSALQRKSFDVIVNGLEPTADRQKQIQFSKPYYIFQLALTVSISRVRAQRCAR